MTTLSFPLRAEQMGLTDLGNECFGYNDFRSLLDNNMVFWNKVREIVNNI